MRYQLPDGQTSISAGVHSFAADIDGIITVPADIGAEVHRDLQDVRLWGLKVVDEAETDFGMTMETESAAAAPPAEPPVPMREHKRNLVALLRGLGHVLDGRATFEFLRRKAIAVLHEMDPESLAAKAAPAPAGDPPPEPAPAVPSIAEIDAATNAGNVVNIATVTGAVVTIAHPAVPVAEPVAADEPAEPAATPAA